jgi:hypothetical protein
MIVRKTSVLTDLREGDKNFCVYPHTIIVIKETGELIISGRAEIEQYNSSRHLRIKVERHPSGFRIIIPRCFVEWYKVRGEEGYFETISEQNMKKWQKNELGDCVRRYASTDYYAVSGYIFES